MRILQIRQILVVFAVLFVLVDTAEAYRGAHHHRLARRRHRPGGRHGRAAFNPYPGQVKPERMIAHKIVQAIEDYAIAREQQRTQKRDEAQQIANAKEAETRIKRVRSRLASEVYDTFKHLQDKRAKERARRARAKK